MNEVWIWVAFNAFVLLLLLIDLGVVNRRAHAVSVREAVIASCVWISIAVAFNAGVYYFRGTEVGFAWTTGYLIEKALSVDNLFVFLVIITAFRVPAELQHRLLFFGLVSALVLRGSMIAVGSYALHQWHWLFYLFGAFLAIAGLRLVFGNQEIPNPLKNPVVVWLQRHIPVTADFEGGRLFIKVPSGIAVTPMLLALLTIELTDVLFALDSVPAIFGITDDPFTVYTSNVFAMLGLRSLYFLLADAVERFHYLKYGLGGVLIFIGAKMLAKDVFPVPVEASLVVVVLILGISIALSLLLPAPEVAPSESSDPQEMKPTRSGQK